MKNPIPQIVFSFLAVLVLALQGCSDEEIQNQILNLSNDKYKLVSQKDSVIKLLSESKTVYDTLTVSYNILNEGNDELKAVIRSLQAGIAARDKQIKAAEEEKTVLNNMIAARDVKNDSLIRVIASLNTQVTDLTGTIAAGEAEKESLTNILEVKQNRIVADSLAEVRRLSAPREYGFVDIVSIGGGVGFVNSDYDYENRLISVDNIFGYQINRNFLTGLGIGAHFYDGGMFVPLFLDFRYKFGNGNLKPFLSADGGFLISFDDFKNYNTTFIQPMIGLNKKLSQKTYLNLSTGLTFMGVAPNSARHRASFFTLKAALSFAGKRGPEI
jgi:uncharacterized lipoprotein YehR (DUF1307 family)